MLWDPILIFLFLFLKKVHVGPVNSAWDPLFFSEMQECTENVRSKRTLLITIFSLVYIFINTFIETNGAV